MENYVIVTVDRSDLTVSIQNVSPCDQPILQMKLSKAAQEFLRDSKAYATDFVISFENFFKKKFKNYLEKSPYFRVGVEKSYPNSAVICGVAKDLSIDEIKNFIENNFDRIEANASFLGYVEKVEKRVVAKKRKLKKWLYFSFRRFLDCCNQFKIATIAILFDYLK